jgi:hypothetical protein
MPAGVGVAQGVVVDIGIPIERLGVPGLRDNGIGLEEAAQDGIIEARPVIIQAQIRLLPLAGEAAVDRLDPTTPERSHKNADGPFRL